MEDGPGPKEKCPPYEYYRFQRHTPKSRWLMAQRVFHGLDPITPELKEVIYACTNCLMCQELCGVRNDGYGPWDITVAMREEITEKEGPMEAASPDLRRLATVMTTLGGSKNRNAGRVVRRSWAKKLGRVQRADFAFRRLFGGSSERSGAALWRWRRCIKMPARISSFLAQRKNAAAFMPSISDFAASMSDLKENNLATIQSAGGITKWLSLAAVASESGANMPRPALANLSAAWHRICRPAGRSGRLKFTKPIKKKVTYHDSCHLGRGAAFTSRREEFFAQFPASSWSRWNAIDAGAGVAAAAVECPKRIPSWRNGTPPIACVRPRRPAPKSC